MVLLGGLPLEVHSVVDGHIVFALLADHQVRVHISQVFRYAERQPHRLPGGHRTKGLLELGVEAIEQTRQNGSFLSNKKVPENAAGISGTMQVILSPQREGAYLPMGTVGACQMSRA